jgi:hypothetical protein
MRSVRGHAALRVTMAARETKLLRVPNGPSVTINRLPDRPSERPLRPAATPNPLTDNVDLLASADIRIRRAILMIP